MPDDTLWLNSRDSSQLPLNLPTSDEPTVPIPSLSLSTPPDTFGLECISPQGTQTGTPPLTPRLTFLPYRHASSSLDPEIIHEMGLLLSKHIGAWNFNPRVLALPLCWRTMAAGPRVPPLTWPQLRRIGRVHIEPPRGVHLGYPSICSL